MGSLIVNVITAFDTHLKSSKTNTSGSSSISIDSTGTRSNGSSCDSDNDYINSEMVKMFCSDEWSKGNKLIVLILTTNV